MSEIKNIILDPQVTKIQFKRKNDSAYDEVSTVTFKRNDSVVENVWLEDRTTIKCTYSTTTNIKALSNYSNIYFAIGVTANGKKECYYSSDLSKEGGEIDIRYTSGETNYHALSSLTANSNNFTTVTYYLNERTDCNLSAIFSSNDIKTIEIKNNTIGKINNFETSCFNKTILTSFIFDCGGKIDNTITISDGMFSGFTSLETFKLDGIDSIGETIGKSAFSGCNKLSSVTFSVNALNGVKTIDESAFQECKSLKTITLPNSLETIGNSAFNYCIALSSISIPQTVSTIGSYAFYYCSSLTSVGDSFNTCNIKSINESTFRNCSNLKSITLPSKVIELKEYSFCSCTSLSSVSQNNISSDIKHNIKTIGNNAFEYCYKLDNVYFTNNVDSIGENAFYACTSLTKVELSSNANFNTLNFGVFRKCSSLITLYGYDDVEKQDNVIKIPLNIENIDSFAFSSCSCMTTLQIPSGVTKISRDYVFYECLSLSRITIDSSNTNYSDYGINSVVEKIDGDNLQQGLLLYGSKNSYINSSVKSIYKYAFHNFIFNDPSNVLNTDAFNLEEIMTSAFCHSNISNIYIPSSTSIIGSQTLGTSLLDYKTTSGTSVFAYCSNITAITVNEGNQIYKDNGNNYICLKETDENGNTLILEGSNNKILDGTQYYICSYAFSSRKLSQENLIIGGDSNVSTVGSYSFASSSGITNVTINNSASFMDKASFVFSSSNVKTITFNNVETIPSNICYYCGQLTDVFINSGATQINNYSFAYCSKLKNLTFNSAIKNIGANSFISCDNLSSITIPNSVETISASAFTRCYSLSSITIPDSVGTIGDRAFYYCSGLTSVVVGNGVTSIGAESFNSCSGLKSISIPYSVTEIKTCAFSGCTSLTSVTIGSGVTSIGSSAFASCKNLSEIKSYAATKPKITITTFQNVKIGGTLRIPSSSNYETWMEKTSYYLGYYNWTCKNDLT